MSETPPTSPFKSYQEKLGWFFGPGIPALDPTKVTIESDVIKFCIHIFDNFNDGGIKPTRETSQDRNNEIIREIQDMLVDYFKSQDPSIVMKEERTIFNWIKNLFLVRAKKYEFRLHRTKKHVDDPDWIAMEMGKFNNIVRLGKTLDTPPPTPNQKRKFFDEEVNFQLLPTKGYEE